MLIKLVQDVVELSMNLKKFKLKTECFIKTALHANHAKDYLIQVLFIPSNYKINTLKYFVKDVTVVSQVSKKYIPMWVSTYLPNMIKINVMSQAKNRLKMLKYVKS